MIRISLILILFAALSGCEGKKTGEAKMSLKFQPMIARCVGRHVINIPESFSPVPVVTGSFKMLGWPAQYSPVHIVVNDFGSTKLSLASVAQKRRNELKNLEDGNVDVLRFEKTLDEHAVLFRVQKIDDAYVSEVDVVFGASVVAISLDSYHDDYMQAEDKLMRFVRSLKAFDKNQQNSSAQGFCLGTVMVSDEYSEESAEFTFKDSKGENFEIEIDTFRPDEHVSLLERMSGPDSLLTKFNVHPTVLRSHERTVANMRAQEWLGWARLNDEPDAKTLQFTLETMRTHPGKATPSINITFNTAQPLENGMPSRTLISDDEAIQLWDAVINSVRPEHL